MLCYVCYKTVIQAQEMFYNFKFDIKGKISEKFHQYGRTLEQKNSDMVIVLDDSIGLIAIDRDIGKVLCEEEYIVVVNNKPNKKPWATGFERKLCFMVQQ